MTDFPQWCQPAADSTLQQGDILVDFPVLTPRLSDDGPPVLARSQMTCVILTQTCDIPKTSQEWVLVGQAFHYGEAAARMENLKQSSYKKSLAEGNAIADFLLPPISQDRPQWLIVHFRNVFSLPKQYVISTAGLGSRFELISPYREHLAQAFARFLMRVGLPSGLQPYAKDIG